MYTKQTLFPCLVIALFLGSSSSGWAAEPTFRVIVNKSNPVTAMSEKEVAGLFLKKVKKWDDGSKVLPADQKTTAAIRDAFSRSVLGRSPSAVKAYWQKQIFTGRGVPPPQKSSDSAVIAYVQRTPGAIGYVSLRADLSKVKVVRVTE